MSQYWIFFASKIYSLKNITSWTIPPHCKFRIVCGSDARQAILTNQNCVYIKRQILRYIFNCNLNWKRNHRRRTESGNPIKMPPDLEHNIGQNFSVRELKWEEPPYSQYFGTVFLQLSKLLASLVIFIYC